MKNLCSYYDPLIFYLRTELSNILNISTLLVITATEYSTAFCEALQNQSAEPDNPPLASWLDFRDTEGSSNHLHTSRLR